MSVRGVNKTFRLPHQRYSTLKERALHPFAGNRYDELEALRDVSFDVKRVLRRRRAQRQRQEHPAQVRRGDLRTRRGHHRD
jgi:hypothetical protein